MVKITLKTSHKHYIKHIHHKALQSFPRWQCAEISKDSLIIQIHNTLTCPICYTLHNLLYRRGRCRWTSYIWFIFLSMNNVYCPPVYPNFVFPLYDEPYTIIPIQVSKITSSYCTLISITTTNTTSPIITMMQLVSEQLGSLSMHVYVPQTVVYTNCSYFWSQLIGSNFIIYRKDHNKTTPS